MKHLMLVTSGARSLTAIASIRYITAMSSMAQAVGACSKIEQANLGRVPVHSLSMPKTVF